MTPLGSTVASLGGYAGDGSSRGSLVVEFAWRRHLSRNSRSWMCISSEAQTYCFAFLAASILLTSASLTRPLRKPHVKELSTSMVFWTPAAHCVRLVQISTRMFCSITPQDSFDPSLTASNAAPACITAAVPLPFECVPFVPVVRTRVENYWRDVGVTFAESVPINVPDDMARMAWSLTTGVIGSSSTTSPATRSGTTNSSVRQQPALASLTSHACAVCSMARYMNITAYSITEPTESDQSPVYNSS
ncbi:unnamed protein product [Prorocentrum cordatum]|uniref:Uncharacterized protein n=1 Tax=Prorocentrum cordatum TaxID=2364126 RepID=A0ABN9V1W7_9DINO|nr:unnamed protein product [Polarella glacialis]